VVTLSGLPPGISTGRLPVRVLPAVVRRDADDGAGGDSGCGGGDEGGAGR
jgi:hypothetical protein